MGEERSPARTNAPSGDAVRRAQLAAFLRTRRLELRPEDIGIRSFGTRRVRGLRREEVAYHAGISSTWYTNIEQGRNVNPTLDVLDAIARAMRLNDDERAYLRRLGGFAPVDEPGDPGPTDELRVLLDALSPFPSSVSTPFGDLLAWNDPYVALFGLDPADLPVEHRNAVWLAFVGTDRTHPVDGLDALRQGFVAQLRFELASHPAHDRRNELVAMLNDTSAEFRALWSDQKVTRTPYGNIDVTAHHPRLGPITIRPLHLSTLAPTSLRIAVALPATARDHENLGRLVERPREAHATIE